MLLICDSLGNIIEWTATTCEVITKELVDAITRVEPISPHEIEYRIYDEEIIHQVLRAFERGDIVRVDIDENSKPVGITIEPTDKPNPVSRPLPTLEERIQALEQLELMRLFGGGDA